MALLASSYGSVQGTMDYVRHLTLDAANNPTTADVEAWLNNRSALLNGWCALAGYTVPITNANALLILTHFANNGAAGDAELGQRSAGIDDDDENRRENKFIAEFMRAKDYILSGALAALGATTGDTSSPIEGIYVGGRTSTGQRLQPVFRRTSFGNNPTAESGTKEPGWTEE